MDDNSSCSANCACAGTTVPPPAAGIPAAGGKRQRSIFLIPGMDCPAEEQLVRLCLADLAGLALAFDLPQRRLTVEHDGIAALLLARLELLGLGVTMVHTAAIAVAVATPAPAAAAESGVLRQLLAVNALMFVVELGLGWWAGSAALVADAMDMFADATVYGVALHAVGRSVQRQLAAARFSGGLQFVLALSALAETGRHWVAGVAPEPLAMMGVASLALLANTVCLVLLFRHRHGAVHMQASYIFSASDVLANLGVLLAGGLVLGIGQPWPDWAAGGIISFLVLAGAIRILRLRSPAAAG